MKIDAFAQGVLPRVQAEALARRGARTRRSVARACFVLTWGLLVLAAVDHVWPLGRDPRVAWGLAVLLVAGAYGVQAVRSRFRSPDLLRAARSVERSVRLPAESLQTLVSQHLSPAPGVSPAMLSELSWEVAARFDGKPRLLRRTPKRLMFLPAMVGLAALAGFAVWDSTSVLRVAAPWQERESAAGPKVRVAPGDWELPQGRSMEVTASLENTPGPAYLELSRDREQWVSLEMSPRGASAYLSHLPPVDRDLYYRVRAPGTVSNTYLVKVVVPPLPASRAAAETPEATTRGEAALRASLRRLEGKP